MPGSPWIRRMGSADDFEGGQMVALLILLLILAIFGGFGFAAHFLWFVLIVALALWVLGFFVGGIGSGIGRRRWYGRW